MQESRWFGFGASKNYSYKGKKNKTTNKQFVEICKKTQPELKEYLVSWLNKYYETVIVGDGYIYAKGNICVCLTAHMDTVHKQPIKDFYEYIEDGKHIISSPQGIGGDDRCGIYMIMRIVETTQLRPYILFCEDEEIGGIGSNKFVKSDNIIDLEVMNMIIELDRANANDLVFYDDENETFHAWCEKVTGYKTNYGSFSDISHLCPACGITGVNISCGYYNAHTTDEYVVLEEMETSIQKVIDMINTNVEEGEQYEYIEYIYTPKLSSLVEGSVTFTFAFGDGKEITTSGESFYSCVAQLFINNPNICWKDIYDYYENDALYRF